MFKKILLYKLFIASMAIAPFLAFFTGSGLVSYGFPIILICLIVLQELTSPYPTKIKDWIAIFIFIPFVIYAGYNYFQKPYLGVYLTTHSLTIITLPFIIISFIRLKSQLGNEDYYKFTYNIILFFCLGQLIICFGQVLSDLLGITLPLISPNRYKGLISGTLLNPNDLAAIVLLILYIYTSLERFINKGVLLWIVLTLLLIMTGSRSALLIAIIVFSISRGLSLKNILLIFISFIFIYIIFYSLISNIENATILRFADRISSLYNTITNGVSSDDSSSLRLESYLYFLQNIPNLGFGSGELLNYSEYAGNATFSTGLMFKNPHSLLVEIGYWLGIPGLITFITGIIYLFRFSNQKTLLFLVLVTSSLIPSTVLNNPTFFLFMIQSFFSRKRNLKQLQL